MDRATYNATVLSIVATLRELRSEMLSFIVGDLLNMLCLMDLIDASWLDECFQGTLVNEEKYVSAIIIYHIISRSYLNRELGCSEDNTGYTSGIRCRAEGRRGSSFARDEREQADFLE